MKSRRPFWNRFALAFLALTIGAEFSFGVIQAVHAAAMRGFLTSSPICRVDTRQPIVGLSFDDGPDPRLTPRILNFLRRFHSRATFFLTGEHAMLYPDLVQKELSLGMEIGDHTWSHPHMLSLTPTETRDQIRRTRTELQRQGVTVQLFRPPYGVIGAGQLLQVRAEGLTPIHWSSAPDFYVGGMHLSAEEAGAALVHNIRLGDIILAHDVVDTFAGRREKVLRALEILITNLRRRGIVVTTIGNVLRAGRAVHDRPKRWFWQSGFACPR